jgi:hypothetical protein
MLANIVATPIHFIILTIRPSLRPKLDDLKIVVNILRWAIAFRSSMSRSPIRLLFTHDRGLTAKHNPDFRLRAKPEQVSNGSGDHFCSKPNAMEMARGFS